VEKNVNEVYQIFLNKFLYYFVRAFPLKLVMKREHKNNAWISSGIRVSCQKMRFLNHVKHRSALSRDSLNYINRYHRIYKKVILAAKKGIMTNKY
jgi:hypothetical protein